MLKAQPESNVDPVIEMSPFTINASDDTGYQATSTLAGTRIRTELKDLGAAISVITADFLEDTGATDGASLLSYTTNTEVGGVQGNFSGAEANTMSRFMPVEERTSPQLNQRVRGLGRADLTRGFYLTEIPFDSYNTDRVEVSRGPNSLLFGIGSPGGVINNGLKQPIHNSDFRNFKVRADNYGSLRSEIDLNQSIVDGRVAMRIAGLYDDAAYKQKPAWNLDRRFYGALDIIVFKNDKSQVLDPTILKINGETGSSRGSPPEVIPPSIAYHGWFEPTPRSISQYTGSEPTAVAVSPSEGGIWEYQATYNPFVVSAEPGIRTNSHPSLFTQMGVVFSRPDAVAADVGSGDGLQGYRGTFGWNPAIDTLNSTGLSGTPGVGGASGSVPIGNTREFHTNSPYAESYAIGFAVPTLQNPSVFDYRNNVYSGGVDLVDRRFKAQNFALEQGFFKNRLSVEVAYDRQNYRTMQDFFFTGGSGNSTGGPYDIYVSIAEYLLNGQPNPNLGRAYTRVSQPAIQFRETDRENFRATVFGELDLSNRNGFLRQLGRHRFTGLYNRQIVMNQSREYRDGWGSTDFDIRSATQNRPLTDPLLYFNTMVFTSDSLLGLGSINDVRLSKIGIKRPQPGDAYEILYANFGTNNPAGRGLQTGAAEVLRFLNGENIGRDEIEARAVAWQSYLFSDHLVGLLGYRVDDTKSFGRATVSEAGVESRLADGRWNPDFTRLSANPSLDQSGDTVTWSVVGRYPRRLLGDLPFGMNLQVQYAESENFNPVGIRNNALGQSIEQPTGTTKEYGFLLGFANDRVTVKTNWFDTRINNVNSGVSVNVPARALGIINSYRTGELLGSPFSRQLDSATNPATHPIQSYSAFYDAMINAIPPALQQVANFRQVDSNGDGQWDRLEMDSIQNLVSTQDRVAKGFEVELVANLTPNWRVLANISRQQTVQSNTATVLAEVVEAYQSSMESARLLEMRDAGGHGVGLSRPISELWLGTQVAPVRAAKALDGTVSNEQREWRIVGVTNYQFASGRLKGAGVGGAVRWEDRAATGYVYTLEPESGVPIPVVDRPFFDDGLFSGDLWVSYEKQLFNRVGWKVQLNVRNLVGKSGDIPVKTNPDGQVAVVRIPNPTTIFLTNSFSF